MTIGVNAATGSYVVQLVSYDHSIVMQGSIRAVPQTMAAILQLMCLYIWPPLFRNKNIGANFAFSIYDFDGSGTVDAIYLGDVLRALNLNPTQATVEKLGGTKKKNEKKMKCDEFLPIFSQVKKDKDVGCYEDFLECLKLYDKAEDGKMLSAELSHTLLSLGERLNDAEVDLILKDCLDEEDEDGFVPYSPFLKKMVAGPIFEEAAKPAE